MNCRGLTSVQVSVGSCNRTLLARWWGSRDWCGYTYEADVSLRKPGLMEASYFHHCSQRGRLNNEFLSFLLLKNMNFAQNIIEDHQVMFHFIFLKHQPSHYDSFSDALPSKITESVRISEVRRTVHIVGGTIENLNAEDQGSMKLRRNVSLEIAEGSFVTGFCIEFHTGKKPTWWPVHFRLDVFSFV